MNTNICLYIEGTNKVYKVFKSECEANSFLFLWESYAQSPILELGECFVNTRHLWSYPIHWDIINGIKLNDFEAYEHLLFMEDERELPERWKKFIKYKDGVIAGVYMPFSKPMTGKEYHLNHFVYWMVLNYLQTHEKIIEFFDYNTGESMEEPEYYCWACAYDQKVRTIYSIRYSSFSDGPYYKCDLCPIWRNMYECEHNENSSYQRWSDGGEDCAEEIAKMPWTLFDDKIRGNFDFDF